MTDFERLSVIDRTFVDLEDASHHQHIALTMIFEAETLRSPAGGIDAGRIRGLIGSRIHRIPRYRQKLAWIPLENHPVWVDDPHFELDYHVRHASLPAPGVTRQLKRLAGRLMSQQLDRNKPLWELWVIEGLEDDRFAIVTKTHHCMVDGIAGVDMMSLLLSPTPDEFTEEPATWLPRRPPSPLQLLRHSVERRLAEPFELVARAAEALRDPAAAVEELRERGAALLELARAGTQSASETPLNRPIGPHRRLDWATTDLSLVKDVKKALGGTVNDIVLATVTGALARFLSLRGVSQASLRNLDLRAMVPVSVRQDAARGAGGNAIALWAVPLPVAEPDLRRRIERLREVTEELKRSKQAEGAQVLAAVSEWTVPNLVSMATRIAYRSRTANLVVTNVPGPQIPLYMLGARMVAAYPMLNLLTQQALGVALLSYAGSLHWGFMADSDQLPDLHDFTLAVDQSFAELCALAGVETPAATRGPPAHGRLGNPSFAS